MAAESKRAQALREVERWEQAVARWSSEAVAKRAEADDLRERVGDVVLSDESQAATVAAQLRELQEAAEVAERAAAAAEPRLSDARNAVLVIDAEAFNAEAAELRKTLAAHEQKTKRLVAALEKHEGPYVPEARHLQMLIATGASVVSDDGQPISLTVPRSELLRRDIAVAEARAAVLQDVIAGVDPEIRVRSLRSVQDGKVLGLSRAEFYPPALRGPDAVVGTPLHAARV